MSSSVTASLTESCFNVVVDLAMMTGVKSPASASLSWRGASMT